MNSCKICQIIQETGNLDLKRDVESSRPSRAVATRWGAFGRTTVNKHRANCIGRTKPLQGPEETELQSVQWQGDTGTLNTGLVDRDLQDISPDQILVMFGHDPKKVEIVGNLWEKHRQYWSRDLNEMLWKHSYSFALRRKHSVAANDVDPLEILAKLPAASAKQSPPTKGVASSFVLDWADWQYAKAEGGGTTGLIERVHSALDSAAQRIEELRLIGRNLEELVIVGGGDMVEGCVIYPNQSYGIDGNRREQIRGTVALILYGIRKLAPIFETVRVVVVPGNHGEHRINGNRTEIGDNDDLLVFEMAQVACESDPTMSNVSFEIAEKEMSLTTEIRGWVYGMTHGDVYGRGSGTGIRNKAFNWFKTMAANRHPVGMSDVLLTHHFHHDAMEDWGNTLWVQNPTMDGGSHYFKEFSGHDTKPGMNSWVVTQAERLQDKQVLR